MNKKQLINMFKLREIKGKITHEKIKEKINENIDILLKEKEITFTPVIYLIGENSHSDEYYNIALELIDKMVNSLNVMDIPSFEDFKYDVDSLDINYTINACDKNFTSFFVISKFNKILSNAIIDYIINKEISYEFCNILFRVLNDKKCA